MSDLTGGADDLPTTWDVREALGSNSAVDTCSGCYKGGSIAGTANAAAVDLFRGRPPTPSSISSAATGRGRNKLSSDPNAVGDHTTFRRGPDGRVTHYQDWHENPRNPHGFDPGRRFDGEGRDHAGVPTPHMHERDGSMTGAGDIDASDLPLGY